MVNDGGSSTILWVTSQSMSHIKMQGRRVMCRLMCLATARARRCPSVRRVVRASMLAEVREHNDARARSDLSKLETALRATRRRSRDLPHRAKVLVLREKHHLIILKS